MTRFVFLAAVAAIAVPAFAGDVGVSVQIGEPGYYGRLDLGGFPQPQLIYPNPVVIRGVAHESIYLHVPPGHAKNWGKHCAKYNACGQSVYFVQDSWYNDVYVPRYRESHGGGQSQHGKRQGNGQGHGKGHGNNDD